MVTKSIYTSIFKEASNNSVNCRIASLHIFRNAEYGLVLHLVLVNYGYALLVGNETYLRFSVAFTGDYGLFLGDLGVEVYSSI